MADYLRESGVKWIWEKIKTLLSAKQDKLVSGTNIKTINGNSLLGSGDVVVSGDASGSVDEGRLVWSDEDSPSTLMDIAYLNSNGNKIAGIPPSLVTIEYSADNGATWRDSGISDASKIRLTNHRINGFAYVFPNGSTTLDINYQTRITFDLIEDSATNAWVGCFDFRKIILKCSGIQRNDTHTMTVEMQKYGSTTWDIIKVSRFWGSPGFFSISTPKRIVGYPSASYYRKVRLTWQTGDVYTNIANINGIFFMSDNIVGVGGGKKPSQYAITGTPYSVDYNQNVTFPNAVKGKKLITDGGTSTQVVKGDGSLEEESALAVASAIDAEHAEEADYAGVADKADKLTTARTISLSKGVTSTATAFDGSKDISIPVTKVKSNVVTWSRDATMSTPPITVLAKMGNNNVLAFFKPSALSVEYSTDNGNSWLDYGLTDKEKTNLTTPMVGYRNIYLGKQSGNTNLSSDNRLRITFDFIEGEIRAAIKQLLIKFQNGPSSTSYYYIKISYELYKNYKTDTWISTDDVRVTTNGYITFSTINFHSYDDPTFGFPSQGATYPARMRVEFFRTVADSYNLNISNFIAITSGVSSAPNNMAKMSLPCSLDWQQNATFPANVKGKKLVTDGGTNQQVLLGDGSLIPLSELSPITDADAEILLDNHIHGINVNANGNDVNISVIESSKNGNTWETEEKNIPLPVASQDTAGIISAADKKKIDNINYEDNTLFVGDGTNGMLTIGYESSKASVDLRVHRDRLATIHTTSYNDTTGGSIAFMEANGGAGTMEVNGDKFAVLVLSGAGQVRATLTKENEDGTSVETIIDAEEGITAPKLATIGGTSEQILLGDGTLITFDELKAKLGLI